VSRATDIAWAAGLFEGEGTWITRTKPNAPKDGKRYAVIALQMCDRDVVERFAAVMGCGKVTVEARSERNPKHSDIWRWTTAKRAECLRIAELLLPYMGERRAARAREVIEASRATDLRSDNARYPHRTRRT
jgi:predicted metal-dependent hydrolase